jgi:hypothetical protein
MRETLILEQSRNDSMWHMTDSKKFPIGSFNTLSEAKKFAVENNYRLHIYPCNAKAEWFN